MTIRAGILGATGYTALELMKLLLLWYYDTYKHLISIARKLT